MDLKYDYILWTGLHTVDWIVYCGLDCILWTGLHTVNGIAYCGLDCILWTGLHTVDWTAYYGLDSSGSGILPVASSCEHYTDLRAP